MPSLDLRVPVRQNSRARGLIRAPGDTSGRLARLTSEQHFTRQLKATVFCKRTGCSLRTSGESPLQRSKLAQHIRCSKSIDHSLIHVSFLVLDLELHLDLDLVLVVVVTRVPAVRIPRRETRRRPTRGGQSTLNRWISRLHDDFYVVPTSESTALTRPRLTPPPVLPASALSGIFSTVA